VMEILDSVLEHSSGTPLHLILVTDRASIASVGNIMGDWLASRIAIKVLVARGWRWSRFAGMPSVVVSYVDLADIVSRGNGFIEAIRGWSKETEENQYSHDLFYIAPLLHLGLPLIHRLIMIDIDLVFRADVKELWQEFDQMEERALFAIGRDLSPYYRATLIGAGFIREHPNSELGLPGQYQGVNMGVVLHRLDKQRQSQELKQLLSPKNVTTLLDHFRMVPLLAVQDWFTQVSWQKPHLLHILDCKWNRQVSVQYLRPPWTSEFPLYHQCRTPTEIQVVHHNGCGPTPAFCPGPKVEGPFPLLHLNLNIPALWSMLFNENLEDFKDLLQLWKDT